MAADGTGKIYIGWEQWVAFVIKQAPFLVQTEYYEISKPQLDPSGEGIEVEYAFSSECSPRDWSTPPEWMKKEGLVK